MIAACALAFVRSDHPVRSGMRAGGKKERWIGACLQCQRSVQRRRLKRSPKRRTVHLQRGIGGDVRLGPGRKRARRRRIINPANLRFEIVHVLRRDGRVVPALQQLEDLLGAPLGAESLAGGVDGLGGQLPEAGVVGRVAGGFVARVLVLHHGEDPVAGAVALRPRFPLAAHEPLLPVLAHPRLVRQLPVVDVVAAPVAPHVRDAPLVVVARRHAGVAVLPRMVLAGLHQLLQAGVLARRRGRHPVVGVCGVGREGGG